MLKVSLQTCFKVSAMTNICLIYFPHPKKKKSFKNLEKEKEIPSALFSALKNCGSKSQALCTAHHCCCARLTSERERIHQDN